MSNFSHRVENSDPAYPEDQTHIFTYDAVTQEGYRLQLKFECSQLDMAKCRELVQAMLDDVPRIYVLSSYNGDVAISTQNGYCEFNSDRMHDDVVTSCAFRIPHDVILPIFQQLVQN